MKIDVFSRLDAVCKPEAVLASNTSSIPIMKLARATNREQQVIGIHFFNPVPVLPLVELVTSLLDIVRDSGRHRAVRHRHAGQDGDPLARPRRFHRQRVC